MSIFSGINYMFGLTNSINEAKMGKKKKNEQKNTTTNRIAPFANECYSTTVSNVNTLQENIICDFNWNRFHVRAKKSVMHCLFTQ